MSLRQSGGSERGAAAEGESSCEGRRKEAVGGDGDGARAATTTRDGEQPRSSPWTHGEPPAAGEPQDLGVAAGVRVCGLG